MAKSIKYSVTPRQDGGYTLSLSITKRSWIPITAEGFFPKENLHYQIEIVGKGKSWSFRGQGGYYYSLHEIESPKTHWDLGYVWVDAERKNLYINLFWAVAPNRLRMSDVNGKYGLQEK